jgi:hypothetical protein
MTQQQWEHIKILGDALGLSEENIAKSVKIMAAFEEVGETASIEDLLDIDGDVASLAADYAYTFLLGDDKFPENREVALKAAFLIGIGTGYRFLMNSYSGVDYTEPRKDNDG